MTRTIAHRVLAAAYFDGSASNGVVSSLTGGVAANAIMSIPFRFKTHSTANQSIFSFEGASSRLGLNLVSGSLSIVKTGGTALVTTTYKVEPGRWVTGVYVYNGSTHYIYITNQTTATNTTSPDVGVLNYLKVGNNANNSDNYFNGGMSSLGYYGRILSSVEIEQFLAGYTRPFTSPILHFNFEESAGSVFYDGGPNGNNASTTGVTYRAGEDGNTPTNIRRQISRKTVFNGDFELHPPAAASFPQTVGTRWINGSAGGSFSDNMFGWWMDNNGTSGVNAQFDTTVFHSGTASMRLSTTSTSGRVSAKQYLQGVGRDYFIRINPNSQLIKLTAWIKCNNCLSASIAINQFNAYSNTAYKSSATAISGTQDWTKVELTILCDENVKYIGIEIRNVAPGNISDAWFDDIYVELLAAPKRPSKVAINRNMLLGINSPFALDRVDEPWTQQDLINYCDAMVAMGVKWIRASYPQASIKYDNNSSYNWAKFDLFTQTCIDRGLKVLPIVQCGNASLAAYDPNGFKSMQYMQDFAAHYAAFGVDHFELWNEFNTQYNSGSNVTPELYYQILALCSPAIKAGNPNAKVVFSGLTGSTIGVRGNPTYSVPDFYQRIYEQGGKDLFDIANYHPYGYTEYMIESVYQIMCNYGDQNKEFWLTEDGIPTSGGGVHGPEWQQADYLVDHIRKSRAYGFITMYMIYNGNNSLILQPDREGYFGVMRGPLSALEPKPAYFAVRDTIANG